MENNLDKLFKSKLGNLEPEFHPAAWDRMEGLLDESGMSPAQEEKPKRSRKIYLFFLLFGMMFSAIGFYSIESSNTKGEGSALVDSRNTDLEKDQSITINNNSTIQSPSNNNVISSYDSNDSNGSNEKSNQKEALITIESSIQEASLAPSDTKVIERKIEKDDGIPVESKSKNIGKKATPPQLITPIAANADNRNKLIPIQDEDVQSERSKHDLIAENLKLENTDGNYSNQIARNKSESTTSDVQENSNADLLENKPNELLSSLPLLQTRTSQISLYNKLISPQIDIIKPSVFEIGIQASIRPGSGLGYSVGPYMAYSLGQGFRINLGAQFDSQDFESGPQLSVYDKVYGFGSEIIERKFALSNQKSLRVPLTVSRSFSGFSLSSGLMLNKVFATAGSISNEEEGVIESDIVVDNEMIHSMTISYQLGASISLSRHLDFDLGMEYRPKAFVSDPTTSNDASKYYPTLGLRYKLFKF